MSEVTQPPEPPDAVEFLLRGERSAAAALAKLAQIEAHPLARPWFVRLAAYGLAGAAVTPVLGGGWRELVAGGIVGLAVGALSIAAGTTANAEPVVAPAAGIAASFCAAAIAQLGLHAAPDIVTLGALVTLLPGMSLTIGMRELATEHLQSGVANTANALVQLLGLVFGVGVGRSIALNWFGSRTRACRTPASAAPICSRLSPRGWRSPSRCGRGIDAAFNTFVTAMAIAYGLMVSTVVLPRRLPEGSTQRESRPSPP